MRRRFFVDHFESNSAVLRGDSADHLGRVLRAEPGQLYELSDGERVWLARIDQVAFAKRGASRIEFALVEPLQATGPRLQIDLLLSIVKFERFEWCLEKATELGASSVTPLAAARTDKPLISAAKNRHERWQKILLESAQQARRLKPPTLHETLTPQAVFSQAHEGLKVILSERRDAPSLRELFKTSANVSRAVLAIGPEGGWTDSENAAARAGGFAEASLGENILRTETAVLAAIAIIGFVFGE